jgi:undecaprenyl-diphosphatase
MIDIIQAIILGIIQGLTEFLPVSSSGHIELGKYFLGFEPEESLLFTVVVHFATALSTVVVFRKDILGIIAGINKKENQKFTLLIITSMIPAAFVGFFFNDFIESLFEGQIVLIAFLLIVTGLLLFFADKARKTTKSMGYMDALIIGIAQAIAILPGISRSGATISASVLLKIDRSEAARFSFLMVIPLIFGKIAKDLIGGEISINNGQFAILLAGFIAAFIVGMIACTWMIRLVVNAKLRYFSYYCFFISVFTLAWFTVGSK